MIKFNNDENFKCCILVNIQEDDKVLSYLTFQIKFTTMKTIIKILQNFNQIYV